MGDCTRQFELIYRFLWEPISPVCLCGLPFHLLSTPWRPNQCLYSKYLGLSVLSASCCAPRRNQLLQIHITLVRSLCLLLLAVNKSKQQEQEAAPPQSCSHSSFEHAALLIAPAAEQPPTLPRAPGLLALLALLPNSQPV